MMYKDWILCWTHTMHSVSFREKMGVGSRVLFEYNDPLPDDFNSFLNNDDNKTDLNKLISQLAIRATSWTWEGEVYVTYGKGVRSRSDGNVDIMRWIDGVHEEADNIIVIHIADMIRNDITKIKLRTVDTDVIVIMLAFMPQFLELNKNVCIWADFGTGDHRRLISINDSYDELGDSICLGLLFFTVSQVVIQLVVYLVKLKGSGLICG